MFVRHRIAAESDEVWRLPDAGARVHVCGDGSRKAPGVREAVPYAVPGPHARRR